MTMVAISKKYILIFLMSAFFIQCNSFASITFNLGTAEVVSVVTAERVGVVSEDGGDNSTEAGATKIYLPIDTDLHPATPTPTAVLKNEYTVFGEPLTGDRTGSKIHSLPRITPQVSGTPSDIYADNPRIRFTITTDNSAKNYLYVAAKDSSGTYKIMQLLDINGVSGNYVDVNPSESYYVEFTVKSLCERGTCSSTLGSYSTGSNNLNISQLIYYFTADETLVVGDTASPTTFTDGNYAKIFMSDVISTTPVSFQSLRRGDTLAIANFSGSTNQGNIGEGVYKILTFIYSGGTTPTTAVNLDEALDYGGTFRFYEAQKEGDFKITQLVNGNHYEIGLGMVNKFKFVSTITTPKLVTPEKIEAFINKQSCYLFSAGFQSDHYVLTYLRYIRDSYLLTNKIGKIFVGWYYQTAPKLTHYIYNSETLSFLVRAVGYFFYYTLNYFFLILSLLILFWVLVKIRFKLRKV
ncbi:MAG: CFI-box-CTERM domain-containing protein [Bacteriovoracaceae bacterium]